MYIIDFLIGFFLMNAMPHFVLGVWGGRILSAFGFGSRANITYGMTCFLISLSLFLYQYRVQGFREHGIYAGAVFILFVYFMSAHIVRNFFAKKKM